MPGDRCRREPGHTRRYAQLPQGAQRHRWSGPAGPPIPVPARRLHPLPVDLHPTIERGQRFAQRPSEVRQLVERGRLDVFGVEMPSDQAVTLRTSQRLGQHLEGDASEAVVEVLVTMAAVGELPKDGEGPAPVEEVDGPAGLGGRGQSRSGRARERGSLAGSSGGVRCLKTCVMLGSQVSWRRSHRTLNAASPMARTMNRAVSKAWSSQ
jgi:hypothetical protein